MPWLFKYTAPLAPFLIISDVNLSGKTGFDIKKRIQEDAQIKYRSVSFIFWSTTASEKQIQYAYDLPAQAVCLYNLRCQSVLSPEPKIIV